MEFVLTLPRYRGHAVFTPRDTGRHRVSFSVGDVETEAYAEIIAGASTPLRITVEQGTGPWQPL
jgi:hypothetical protein